MIIRFPRELSPHVEIVQVRDRNDGRSFFVFDLVGIDEFGPFRIDIQHCHSIGEVADALPYYLQQGIKVDGSGVLL